MKIRQPLLIALLKSHSILAPLLVVIPFAGTLAAEIIPADRRTDWTPGVVTGVPGGIPNRTTIFVNVKTTPNGNYHCAADGATDDGPAIQAAIRDCPAGQVVYAPAGTYKIASVINTGYNHENWTLRGDGQGRTILKGAAGIKKVVTTGTSDNGTESAPNGIITAGATKGSSTITLADTSGKALGWDGVKDGKLIKILPGANPPYVHNLNTAGNGATIGFMHKVVSHTPTTVTFAPPLGMDMSSFNPRLAIYPTSSLYVLVNGVGIEDLTFDCSSMTGGWAWEAYQMWGSWMKNVEVSHPPTKQIYWQVVGQSEIRHCYFHDNQGGGSSHEGVDLAGLCSWNLIEDNICVTAGQGQIVMNDAGGSCSGNVIAYNYCIKVNVGSPDTSGADLSLNHGPHNMMNLIEGNVVGMIQSDGYFGSSSHNTIFRNWITVTHPTATNGMRGIDLDHYSTYFNVVGNVIGTSDFSGNYDSETRNYPNTRKVIYRLGYPNMGNTCFGITGNLADDTIGPDDPPNYSTEPFVLGSCGVSGAQKLDYNVKATLLRHGNYDYANHDTIWDSKISDHKLPDSLYLPKRPSWWPPDLAWPSIGPDKTPISGTIPAEIRYKQLANAPGPPSKLRIIPP